MFPKLLGYDCPIIFVLTFKLCVVIHNASEKKTLINYTKLCSVNDMNSDYMNQISTGCLI